MRSGLLVALLTGPHGGGGFFQVGFDEGAARVNLQGCSQEVGWLMIGALLHYSHESLTDLHGLEIVLVSGW